METTKQLVDRLRSTHQLTSALNNVFREVEQHAQDQDKMLLGYSAAVEACLQALLDPESKHKPLETMSVIQEVLSAAHAGDVSKCFANIEETVSNYEETHLGEEFVINL